AKMRHQFLLAMAACLTLGSTSAADVVQDVLTGDPSSQTLSERLQLLDEALRDNPDDERAALAVALLTMHRTIERRAQAAYRFGLRAPSNPLDLMLGGLMGGKKAGDEMEDENP